MDIGAAASHAARAVRDLALEPIDDGITAPPRRPVAAIRAGGYAFFASFAGAANAS